LTVTVQDTGSGLNQILVTTAVNIVVTYSAYTPGTTAAVQVSGTRQVQTLSATIQLKVTDVAGNATTCDPLMVDSHIGADGSPDVQTLTNVPGAEHYLLVQNDTPGLQQVSVNVDDSPAIDIGGLQDQEQLQVDLAPPMSSGTSSTVQLTASGAPGSGAGILIGDMPLAGVPVSASQSQAIASSPSAELSPEIIGSLPAGTGLDVTYDPNPTLTSDAQFGNSSLGRLRPVGTPIRVRVRAEDVETGAQTALSDDLASKSVGLQLPVLASGSQPDGGEFAWLAEVRQSGQFVGYRRLDTTYDGTSNTLQATMSLAELDDTLLLPAILEPAFAHASDPNVHLWSSAIPDGAVDFGVLTDPNALLTVVGPNVAGRLYVYDPVSTSYGWADADAMAPAGVPLVP